MLGWRAKRAQVVGRGVASGGGAASTPPAEAAGDVAALRSRVGELERRNAELAEQKAGLEREIEGLRKENAELRATAAAGEAQLRDLRAQLGQNSRNSSRPPSSDGAAGARSGSGVDSRVIPDTVILWCRRNRSTSTCTATPSSAATARRRCRRPSAPRWATR